MWYVSSNESSFSEKELEDYKFNEECDIRKKWCEATKCKFNIGLVCLRHYMLKRGIKIEPQRKDKKK